VRAPRPVTTTTPRPAWSAASTASSSAGGRSMRIDWARGEWLSSASLVQNANSAYMRSAIQCAVQRSAPSTRARLATAARRRSVTSQKLAAAIA
jgi:hypothetical protein